MGCCDAQVSVLFEAIFLLYTTITITLPVQRETLGPCVWMQHISSLISTQQSHHSKIRWWSGPNHEYYVKGFIY